MAGLQMQVKQLEEINEDFMNESSRMVNIMSRAADRNSGGVFE